MKTRPKFNETTQPEKVDPNQYPFFSFKYDGNFGFFYFAVEVCKVYSSTGRLVSSFPFLGVKKPTLLYGELMRGTQWSKTNPEAKGVFAFVYDIAILDGETLDKEKRSVRYNLLMNFFWREKLNQYGFKGSPLFNTSNQLELVLPIVVEKDYEGLVFYPEGEITSTLLRWKRVYEHDVKLLSYTKGRGALRNLPGSIKVRTVHDPNITYLVGGGMTLSDRYTLLQFFEYLKDQNTIFKVRGNAVFKSGILRHPRFFNIKEELAEALDCKKITEDPHYASE